MWMLCVCGYGNPVGKFVIGSVSSNISVNSSASSNWFITINIPMSSSTIVTTHELAVLSASYNNVKYL